MYYRIQFFKSCILDYLTKAIILDLEMCLRDTNIIIFCSKPTNKFGVHFNITMLMGDKSNMTDEESLDLWYWSNGTMCTLLTL